MGEGVYLLIKEFDVIYVGHSKNCERRLKEHQGKDYDYYVFIPTRKHKQWEIIFIAFLKPVLNIQGKYRTDYVDSTRNMFTSLKNDRRTTFYIN